MTVDQFILQSRDAVDYAIRGAVDDVTWSAVSTITEGAEGICVAICDAADAAADAYRKMPD